MILAFLCMDKNGKKIKTVSRMSGCCDMRDIVMHVHEETRKARVGSSHENNSCFYYDALSQMSNKETLEWMRSKDCLRHWTLLENWCNKGVTCTNHPVRNTLEKMPLDESLSNYLDEAIRRRMVHSSRLDHADPKKCSLATTSRVSSAHHHMNESQCEA